MQNVIKGLREIKENCVNALVVVDVLGKIVGGEDEFSSTEAFFSGNCAGYL